jgi:hypothetical protein
MFLGKYLLFFILFLIRLESLPEIEALSKGLKSLFFAELGLFYESDQYRKITNLDERYRSRIKFTLDFVEKEKKRHPLAPDAFEMIESDLFFLKSDCTEFNYFALGCLTSASAVIMSFILSLKFKR